MPFTKEKSIRENPYSLKSLKGLLKELEKKNIINSYSIQNKIINSKYKYTYVCFKINRLSTNLERKEMIKK